MSFVQPAILGESATLEVLKHVRLRDLKRLSFNWTTVGDDTPPSIDPNRPNVLSFKNVNKEDLDYYKCEVKEAGEVVLTVLRALHRDESRGLYIEYILVMNTQYFGLLYFCQQKHNKKKHQFCLYQVQSAGVMNNTICC